MFSAVASVVPVVKKVATHRTKAPREVSNTARPPPWLVAEAQAGAKVRLVQEILAARLADVVGDIFGDAGGPGRGNGGVRGAPGPIAGAGLPFLGIAYGVYWLIRRRQKAD